ncbi:MAG: NUDIX domain-containing protein [Acidobacteriota bacterium]|nr:NUDIX domain-containing protein [Acidobacteriota bacterium]
MSANDTNQLKQHAKDLLLEEYRYYTDSFWKNEQTGETRVNWFIGIVTAAAGGLVGLTSTPSRPHGEPLRLIFVASLFALLSFGIITLFRIIKRNIVSDTYKRAADHIREIFSDHFDGDHILLHYHPFGKKKKGGDKGVARRLGGLTHTVLTITSLLLAGLVAALVFPLHSDPLSRRLSGTYMAATVAFALAFAGQFFWVKRIDKTSRLKLRARDATHAGGVVYRFQNATLQYLLVGPKHEVANEWIFPKGHIDPGEESWKAAMREVREETGVLAQVICLAGRDEFQAGDEKVVAKYYLMESFAEVEPEESRRLGWFNFDEALTLLTHTENKHLLQEAERKRRNVSGQQNDSQQP